MKLVVYELEIFKNITEPPYAIEIITKYDEKANVPIHYIKLYGFPKKDSEYSKRFNIIVYEEFAGVFPPQYNDKLQKRFKELQEMFKAIVGRIEE